jgi:hypothetical protein
MKILNPDYSNEIWYKLDNLMFLSQKEIIHIIFRKDTIFAMLLFREIDA